MTPTPDALLPLNEDALAQALRQYEHDPRGSSERNPIAFIAGLRVYLANTRATPPLPDASPAPVEDAKIAELLARREKYGFHDDMKTVETWAEDADTTIRALFAERDDLRREIDEACMLTEACSTVKEIASQRFEFQTRLVAAEEAEARAAQYERLIDAAIAEANMQAGLPDNEPADMTELQRDGYLTQRQLHYLHNLVDLRRAALAAEEPQP